MPKISVCWSAVARRASCLRNTYNRKCRMSNLFSPDGRNWFSTSRRQQAGNRECFNSSDTAWSAGEDAKISDGNNWLVQRSIFYEEPPRNFRVQVVPYFAQHGRELSRAHARKEASNKSPAQRYVHNSTKHMFLVWIEESSYYAITNLFFILRRVILTWIITWILVPLGVLLTQY